MVVTVPMNRLPHANATKAVLGTEKMRLVGYIRGMADKLCLKDFYNIAYVI